MSKRTAFYDKHIEAGGRMVEFVGFQMPMSYGKGIMAEVKRVRTTAGLFDVSHMGEIEVKGSDALEFVNLVVTNDAAKLEEFQVQYACLCYPDGGIVDDLLVYRLPDKYLLVVNASNTLKDYEWIQDNRISFGGSVLVKNTSDAVAQLALQGPASEKILSGLTDFNPSEMAYYWSRYGEVAGKSVLVSRTGYTGEDGFEIYSNTEDAVQIWDAVLDAGRELDVEPVALGARDLLRLEMGYCLYGNDIDETTNPLEAGLGWITKLAKERFVGREPLIAQKEAGLKRRLVGFELEGRSIARHGHPIYAGKSKVGTVTSGNFSPTIEKSIGMGYVDVNVRKEGTEIEVDIRGTRTRGVIVKTPFVKNTSIKR
jgi:aminomethyltransferase